MTTLFVSHSFCSDLLTLFLITRGNCPHLLLNMCWQISFVLCWQLNLFTWLFDVYLISDASHSVVRLELKGPDNSLRLRQIRVLGEVEGESLKLGHQHSAQTIQQRNCETETLRVFRLITSQVFRCYYINVLLLILKMEYMETYGLCVLSWRGAQIPGTRSPGKLSTVLWSLMFVSCVWNLRLFTPLVPRILRWPWDILKICVSL